MHCKWQWSTHRELISFGLHFLARKTNYILSKRVLLLAVMWQTFVHWLIWHLLGMNIMTGQAFIPCIQNGGFGWGRCGDGGSGCLCQAWLCMGLLSSTRKRNTKNKLLTRWLGTLGHVFYQRPSFMLSFWLLQKLMLLRQSASGLELMMLAHWNSFFSWFQISP